MKEKDTTLSPLWLVNALGWFDFDPCAYPGYPTAKELNVWPSDGLNVEWKGRVWLNLPYSNPGPWLKKLAQHGRGVALVLASTETKWFQEEILAKATSILFLRGRPKFLRKDMTEVGLMRGVVLVSYGEVLDGRFIPGVSVKLRTPLPPLD